MTQTIPLGSDARERFLLEISAVLPPERIVEAHFFAPLRQGQVETGVCVLGALPEGAEPEATDAEQAEAEPAAVQAAADAPDESSEPVESLEPAYPEGARISSRHVVYSARYRWTRKGPERGKWECEVVAEADAPLLTVDAVVAGVKQRANEPLDVQKLDGDTVRAMLAQAQRQWQTTP
jgi:hypothetical protein